MSEIQTFDYQKINEQSDYNNEDIKKVLIQIREKISQLETRIKALEG